MYANIRPDHTHRGLPSKAGNVNLVVLRENAGAFYADRNKEQGSGKMLVARALAISLRWINHRCCECIVGLAFALARAGRT